jgi:mannose-6-phosphate isomerase-like protein (cupin superfamily)
MGLKSFNLEAEAGALTEHWSPRVVARVNDAYVKVAKVVGEFVWHAHEHEDEMFLILRGRIRIEMDGEVVELGAGDAFVVPKGVRHNPVAEEECWLALIEPVQTTHTGDVVSDRTKSIDEQLGET